MRPIPDPTRNRIGGSNYVGDGRALRDIYPPDAAADEVLQRLIERLEGVASPLEDKVIDMAERVGRLNPGGM